MTVLALYPQFSTLHLALSSGNEHETADFALTSKAGQALEKQILAWLAAQDLPGGRLRFIVTSGQLNGAGGSGVYEISQALLQAEPVGCGALLAQALAERLRLPAYLIDPHSLGGCAPHSLITGTPEFSRSCCGDSFIFKYLVGQELKQTSLKPEAGRFIVAHLDRTVQIGAICGQHVVDMGTSADEGPFSWSQAGGLPFDALLDLCAALNERQKVLHKVGFEAGLKGYLGLRDFSELDPEQLRDDSVWQAFVYQISKEIGAYCAALKGKIDAILLSGDLINFQAFTAELAARLGFLGRISLYPGNQGLPALLAGAKRVMRGEPILTYRNKGGSTDGIH